MQIPKKILITGASGLIGSRLTELLHERGHEVSHLGRAKKPGPIKSFTWNIDQNYIESGALSGVDAIIHLAGAGVADNPWTEKRKEEILLSRTKSTRLLYDELKKGNHSIQSFVCASGIGYYGVEDTGEPLTEECKAGEDFLADVTRQWEAEADKINELMRVCKLRTGFVLSNKGGALPELATPVKWFVGAALGTGKQYVNWIHIDDLCAIYIRMIEDNAMIGTYNGTAPYPVTNRDFTKTLTKVLNRPLLFPAAPTFVLKMLLGEMAYLVLKSGRVSSAKIQQTGFTFGFIDLEQALRSLLK